MYNLSYVEKSNKKSVYVCKNGFLVLFNRLFTVRKFSSFRSKPVDEVCSDSFESGIKTNQIC